MRTASTMGTENKTQGKSGHLTVTDRFREHVDRFEYIADMIENGNINDEELKKIESIDNCFAEIDYRVYMLYYES